MSNRAAHRRRLPPLSWLLAVALALTLAPVQASAQTPASSPLLQGAVSPEHQAILDRMRELDVRLRTDREAGAPVNQETVGEFNRLAEQANQINAAAEAARAAARAARGLDTMDEELARLRLQQEVLTRQLQQIVDQQRRLNETHLRLLTELNRMRRAPRP